MFGLLYPAVLGTVFVSFISEDLKEFSFHPRLVFGLIFIYHWGLQFAFSTIKGKEISYSLSKFVGDIILIIGMNVVFFSLPNYQEYLSGAAYTWFYFGLFLIGGSFVTRELFDIFTKGFPLRKSNLLINAFLMLEGAVFFAISLYLAIFAKSSLICFIVIFSTLLASILNTILAKSKNDKHQISK